MGGKDKVVCDMSGRVGEDDNEIRCWICLGGQDEEAPNGIETVWKRPCGCNLVAHESCLLEWTSEVASGKRAPPVCPQCKSVIHVTKRRSRLLQLRHFVESTNRIGFQFLIVSTVGGGVLCTIYTTLYTLGASSIRFICPSDLALRVLGVHVDGASVRLEPLTWRRLALIPMVPVMLVFSSSRARVMDLLSFALPLALSDKTHLPWNFQGPRLTLALLPWLRLCYHSVYDALVDPFIQACARRLRPSQDPGASDGDDDDFNIRLVIENEEQPPPQDEDAAAAGGEEEEQQQQQLAPGDENGAGGMVNGLVYSTVEWLVDFLDEDATRTPPPPQSANWVISPRSLSLKIGNALLLPLLSGMAGSMLSGLPFMRRLVPDRFNRNVIGGLLVIGARDVVNIITAILRVRQENSRSVLEYHQLDHHNCIHHNPNNNQTTN